MNQFETLPGGGLINTISVAWADFVEEGTDATVLLFGDPLNSGDPTQAVLLASTDTVVTAPGNNRFVDVPIEPTNVKGTFLVAALIRNLRPHDLIAPIDSSKLQGRSWFVTHDVPGELDVVNLSNNSAGVTPTFPRSLSSESKVRTS